MAREDEDVCQALGDLLAGEGIDVHLDTHVQRVSGKSGNSVSLVVTQNGAEKTLTGSHVLVATGRIPNTASAQSATATSAA